MAVARISIHSTPRAHTESHTHTRAPNADRKSSTMFYFSRTINCPTINCIADSRERACDSIVSRKSRCRCAHRSIRAPDTCAIASASSASTSTRRSPCCARTRSHRRRAWAGRAGRPRRRRAASWSAPHRGRPTAVRSTPAGRLRVVAAARRRRADASNRCLNGERKTMN